MRHVHQQLITDIGLVNKTMWLAQNSLVSIPYKVYYLFNYSRLVIYDYLALILE